MLAATLPYRKADFVVLALLEPNVHVDMTNILREGSAGALHGDETGLDIDGDSLWDIELFSLEDVPHLVSKYKYEHSTPSTQHDCHPSQSSRFFSF